MTGPWPLSWLELGGRAVLRLAPGPFRQEFECELRGTFREICLQAYRRAGAPAMLRVGLGELINLAWAALRARLGGQPPMFLPDEPPRPEGRTETMLRTLRSDIRLAARSLLAARVNAAVAVLTLAVGIGTTTAAFSVLDSLIIRPMPFADASRLVEIWTRPGSQYVYPRMTTRMLVEWRSQTDLFDGVEGYEIESAIWKGPRGAEMVSGAFVTPGMFALLGVPPAMGRYFVEGDGRDGPNGLVVVSHGFWRQKLGGGPDVVGSPVTLNGRTHTVVGVMPASFQFPHRSQEVWFPVDPARPAVAGGTSVQLTAMAKMARGITRAQLDEQVEIRGPQIAQAAGVRAGTTSLIRDARGLLDTQVRQSMLVLAGAVGFLLLVVCANVANLSLSRAFARTRDFAVRSSLGASRGDLIRGTLVENACLGAAGVALGLLAAYVMVEAAVVLLPPEMISASVNQIDLDGRALAFTALVGGVTVLLFGLPPALIASRPVVADVLRRDSRSTVGSRASRRLRAALVIGEVTVSIVLLVGAALMTRSFVKLQAVDRGFDSSGLVTVRVGLPTSGYQDPRARDRFTGELIDALRHVPGVRAATAGGVPPDSSSISFGKLEFEHAPDFETESLVVPSYEVWPDYFETTGIPVLEGRPFRPDEPRDSTIVSQSFAATYWPAGSALGGRFRFTGSSAWRTIVGVSGEVRQLDLDDRMGSFEWYRPLRVPPSEPPPTRPVSDLDAIAEYRTVVVRADDPGAVIGRAREMVHAVDDSVVIWTVSAVDDNFAEAVARPRAILFLLTIFAGAGLLLAAAGIYGVLSHLVGQRMKEIGIRLALGASPREVFRLILRSGLALTAVGGAVGVGLALALVRVMRSLLYEVEPTDPLSVAAVVALLGATALLASWRPARRAMQVDPVALLRQE